MGAVGDPSQQSHDWEPGIEPSGLFWTIPFPASAMTADPGAGVARLVGENVAVEDYHDFFNAISDTPDPAPRPSVVSFDVRWAGDGDRMRIRDQDFGFVGEFVSGEATISFTARDDDSDVLYTSVAEGQTTVSAGVGRERNGVFFS
ncbi:MAG TPA: hypothetical protein VFL73_01685 [Solirubrobacteraceae bacterium]|nr:hypothetical protein [Solirubrobacteraceae bacterium]